MMTVVILPHLTLTSSLLFSPFSATQAPSFNPLIPSIIVLTSPNTDVGTYYHYPVSGNDDVFVRGDNSSAFYWTTYCGGAWRSLLLNTVSELPNYVAPESPWYGAGNWYPAQICDEAKAGGKYDLNTLSFSTNCSMSFTF